MKSYPSSVEDVAESVVGDRLINYMDVGIA